MLRSGMQYTSANDVHLRAYLLEEGMMRWNDDRAAAAVASSDDGPSFCDVLKEAADQLSEKVLGQQVNSRFYRATVYTDAALIL